MAKAIKPSNAKSESSEGKERTTINLRGDIMKQMKLIALFDDTSLTDVMEVAMQDYINKWESKHGPLPKKQG